MSNVLIASFLAAGVAAWVYKKINRSTGGNTVSSLTTAGIVGLFFFVLTMIVLSMIPSN